MKTNILFSAFAAIVLSASFSFNANAADNSSSAEISSNSSACYNVVDRVSRVYGGETTSWTMTLLAGEEYRILVNGDGDTDLDLYIYDENGNEIDKDTDSTDYCVCYVTPRWTGEFKIKIKNYGHVYNEYNLVVTR